ncbi:MAG: hypothetical protein JXB62_01425 [Pirellulales bacterium]|nr:hypothetical protein [Pirellulales bacterium]
MRSTNRSWRLGIGGCLLATVILSAGVSRLRAQSLESESVVRQQQVQQQVRAMARQLVSTALDIQLQQLRENGLGSHKWYADIQAMRHNLDTLIDAEMPEVIELLGQIETSDPAARQKTFVAARKKSREIVVRLLVERQSLLRRLRISEMAAQVRRLITVQTTVLTTTELLPEQPATRRETLNLSTLEDQRDVKALYGGLKDVLGEVSGWPGPFGTEAAEGLRRLKAGRVDEELDGAETHLQSAEFPEAATSQRAVIQGLKALLLRIERAQGLAEADRNAASEQIREMIQRQEQVREATRQANLALPEADQLVGRQSEIRQDITQMREAARQVPEMQSALQQAEQSAQEATASLFEQNQEEALAQQDNVLNQLEQAAEQAEQLSTVNPAGLNSEQYAQQIEDLEAAREDLRAVEQEQAQAADTAEQSPAEAKRHEENVARQLDKIPENRDLPEAVESAMQAAEQSATEAAAAMGSQPEQRMESVQETTEAVEQAVSTTEAALADAKREQIYTTIAELAHAARSLDEAAQAEREIAAEAQQAAGNEGLEAEQAQELGNTQADVQAIAEKVAEGVQGSVPKAAETLGQARQPIAEAGKQLQSARQNPGAPSKPAAEAVAQQTGTAAEMLDQAAEQIRDELRRAAEQMAQVGGRQFEQVQQVRENVEQNMANTLDSGAPPMTQQAQQASQLAQQSVPVDPSATSALRDAQHHAEQAAEQGPPPQAASAEQGIQEAMGEAAGSLADRGEQILQDMANAAALAAAGLQPAPEQQAAAPSGEQPGGESPHAQSQAAMPMPGGELPGGELPGGELPGGMPMPAARQPGALPLPGGQPLANEPIREASQLAAAMAGMPAGMPILGMPMPGSMPIPGMPMPGLPSSQSSPGGVSLAGSQVLNAPPTEMGTQPEPDQIPDGRATPDSPRDAEPAERAFLDDPWFARLPPELRKAIRNNSQRRPPRGYEERLNRYFQSID